MAVETVTIFADQVSIGQLLQNLIYASGVVGAIFVVAGLLLVDIGGTRTQHSFNSGIEKVIGFFIDISTYFLIGIKVSVVDQAQGLDKVMWDLNHKETTHKD